MGTRQEQDQHQAERIKINLFLIDPVAGANAGKKPVNPLSPNDPQDNVHIDSLFSLYSRDDEKVTYKPQYPSDFAVSEKVHSAFAEVPGRHSTLGKYSTPLSDPGGKRNKDNNPENPQELYIDGPSTLIQNYALKFLADRNVSLKPSDALRASEDSMIAEHKQLLTDDSYLLLKQSKSKVLHDKVYSTIAGGFKGFKPRTGDENIMPAEAFVKALFDTNENSRDIG